MFYPHMDMRTENFSFFLVKEAYEPGVVNLGEAFNVRRRHAIRYAFDPIFCAALGLALTTTASFEQRRHGDSTYASKARSTPGQDTAPAPPQILEALFGLNRFGHTASNPSNGNLEGPRSSLCFGRPPRGNTGQSDDLTVSTTELNFLITQMWNWAKHQGMIQHPATRHGYLKSIRALLPKRTGHSSDERLADAWAGGITLEKIWNHFRVGIENEYNMASTRLTSRVKAETVEQIVRQVLLQIVPLSRIIPRTGKGGDSTENAADLLSCLTRITMGTHEVWSKTWFRQTQQLHTDEGVFIFPRDLNKDPFKGNHLKEYLLAVALFQTIGFGKLTITRNHDLDPTSTKRSTFESLSSTGRLGTRWKTVDGLPMEHKKRQNANQYPYLNKDKFPTVFDFLTTANAKEFHGAGPREIEMPIKALLPIQDSKVLFEPAVSKWKVFLQAPGIGIEVENPPSELKDALVAALKTAKVDASVYEGAMIQLQHKVVSKLNKLHIYSPCCWVRIPHDSTVTRYFQICDHVMGTWTFGELHASEEHIGLSRSRAWTPSEDQDAITGWNSLRIGVSNSIDPLRIVPIGDEIMVPIAHAIQEMDRNALVQLEDGTLFAPLGSTFFPADEGWNCYETRTRIKCLIHTKHDENCQNCSYQRVKESIDSYVFPPEQGYGKRAQELPVTSLYWEVNSQAPSEGHLIQMSESNHELVSLLASKVGESSLFEMQNDGRLQCCLIERQMRGESRIRPGEYFEFQPRQIWRASVGGDNIAQTTVGSVSKEPSSLQALISEHVQRCENTAQSWSELYSDVFVLTLTELHELSEGLSSISSIAVPVNSATADRMLVFRPVLSYCVIQATNKPFHLTIHFYPDKFSSFFQDSWNRYRHLLQFKAVNENAYRISTDQTELKTGFGICRSTKCDFADAGHYLVYNTTPGPTWTPIFQLLSILKEKGDFGFLLSSANEGHSAASSSHMQPGSRREIDSFTKPHRVKRTRVRTKNLGEQRQQEVSTVQLDISRSDKPVQKVASIIRSLNPATGGIQKRPHRNYIDLNGIRLANVSEVWDRVSKEKFVGNDLVQALMAFLFFPSPGGILRYTSEIFVWVLPYTFCAEILKTDWETATDLQSGGIDTMGHMDFESQKCSFSNAITQRWNSWDKNLKNKTINQLLLHGNNSALYFAINYNSEHFYVLVVRSENTPSHGRKLILEHRDGAPNLVPEKSIRQVVSTVCKWIRYHTRTMQSSWGQETWSFMEQSFESPEHLTNFGRFSTIPNDDENCRLQVEVECGIHVLHLICGSLIQLEEDWKTSLFQNDPARASFLSITRTSTIDIVASCILEQHKYLEGMLPEMHPNVKFHEDHYAPDEPHLCTLKTIITVPGSCNHIISTFLTDPTSFLDANPQSRVLISSDPSWLAVNNERRDMGGVNAHAEVFLVLKMWSQFSEAAGPAIAIRACRRTSQTNQFHFGASSLHIQLVPPEHFDPAYTLYVKKNHVQKGANVSDQCCFVISSLNMYLNTLNACGDFSSPDTKLPPNIRTVGTGCVLQASDLLASKKCLTQGWSSILEDDAWTQMLQNCRVLRCTSFQSCIMKALLIAKDTAIKQRVFRSVAPTGLSPSVLLSTCCRGFLPQMLLMFARFVFQNFSTLHEDVFLELASEQASFSRERRHAFSSFLFHFTGRTIITILSGSASEPGRGKRKQSNSGFCNWEAVGYWEKADLAAGKDFFYVVLHPQKCEEASNQDFQEFALQTMWSKDPTPDPSSGKTDVWKSFGAVAFDDLHPVLKQNLVWNSQDEGLYVQNVHPDFASAFHSEPQRTDGDIDDLRENQLSLHDATTSPAEQSNSAYMNSLWDRGNESLQGAKLLDSVCVVQPLCYMRPTDQEGAVVTQGRKQTDGKDKQGAATIANKRSLSSGKNSDRLQDKTSDKWEIRSKRQCQRAESGDDQLMESHETAAASGRISGGATAGHRRSQRCVWVWVCGGGCVGVGMWVCVGGWVGWWVRLRVCV